MSSRYGYHQTFAIDLPTNWSKSTIYSTVSKATAISAAMSTIRQPNLFCNPQNYVVFVFGGTAGSNPSNATATVLSSVYILTLPAFHWIEAPNSAAASTWRADHTCSLIENPSSDPWKNGMQIFEMTDMFWTENIDSISSILSGPGISQYLLSKHNRKHQNAATVPKTNKSNAGTIAGGAIGGVATLCIVAGLVFWFMKRKQRRTKEAFFTILATKESTLPLQLSQSHFERVMLAGGNLGIATELPVYEQPREMSPTERWRARIEMDQPARPIELSNLYSETK
ncbi:hypothetical protein BDZ45DRAFT_742435 [Acephala macrosclerotiorum]|nr:hypothetical protein BDZ45DRAFT_742435 [Acephala macrosclerotiorum]